MIDMKFVEAKDGTLVDKCLHKVMADKKDSSTFDDVRKAGPTHGLYDCIDCYGTPGSCPNYVSYNALYKKHSLER